MSKARNEYSYSRIQRGSEYSTQLNVFVPSLGARRSRPRATRRGASLRACGAAGARLGSGACSERAHPRACGARAAHGSAVGDATRGRQWPARPARRSRLGDAARRAWRPHMGRDRTSWVGAGQPGMCGCPGRDVGVWDCWDAPMRVRWAPPGMSAAPRPVQKCETAFRSVRGTTVDPDAHLGRFGHV